MNNKAVSKMPTKEKTFLEKVEISGFIAVSAALFYFSGFSYLHSYYKFFEISIIELGISSQYIIAHSFIIFYNLMINEHGVAYAIFALLIFFLFNRVSGGSVFRFIRRFQGYIYAIVPFLFLLGAYGYGREIAIETAKEDIYSFPILRFKEINEIIPEYDERKMEVRFVAASEGIVFGLITYRSGGGSWLLRLPVEKMTNIRIYLDPV